MVPSPRRLPHTIFNRRTAKGVSHRFARVVEHAVQLPPTTYDALVAQTPA
jgi:hypothetical protein